MSVRVVLDSDNVVQALNEGGGGIVHAIVEICDQITVNELILQEYSYKLNVSAVVAELARLNEGRPRPKFIEPNMGPVPQIQSPSSHRRLIIGAIRAKASVLITNIELRGRWSDLAETLKAQHQLLVLSPDQYLSERGRPS